MDLVLTNLAPNRTASIQLYVAGTNTPVGSPIAGTSSGFTYTFEDLPVGEYDYVLLGFTTPSPDRRRIRVAASGDVGSPTPGTEAVIIQLNNSGMPVASGTVTVSLNNVVIHWGLTDALGRVNFLLNPGNYTVAVNATGYVAQVGVPLVVPLSATPHVIALVSKPMAPPDSCDVCACEDIESASPVTALGDGCCDVDHNYGGLFNLAYRTANCEGVVGATIEVFAAADWNAGNTDPSFSLLTTATITGGLWAARFKLNTGDYVLRFEKPGEHGPDIYNLTVNCDANPPSSFTPSVVSPFGM